MNRSTLKRALEKADLTAYEAEAYLTLVDYGRLAAVDVAKKSDIPSSQIYETLRSLESKGFVDTIDQDRLHAEPSDPVDVLTHLRERGELFTDAAEELENRWEQPDLKDHRVGVVKHADTVIEHVRNRIRETDVAVEVALTADQFESLRRDLRAAANRGVVVHIAVYYEPDLRDRSESWELSGRNLELRVVEIPGPFIAVLDRSRTYFAPNSRATENYGILINDDILSFINHWYYQTCLWYPWEPLVPNRDLPRPYVSLKEFIRDISPLHNDGVTIAATIAGIDVSTGEFRTVTGTVTDIYYPDMITDDSPSIVQLSTYAVVTLDTGTEALAVGGAGRWVVDRLAAEPYEIVAVDRELPTGTPPDAVVHLAAIPDPLNHAGERVYRNNVLSTYNVLNAAGRVGADVTWTSSESAYGFPFAESTHAPEALPIEEDHPLRPADPYGLSKVSGEETTELFAALLGEVPDPCSLSGEESTFSLAKAEDLFGWTPSHDWPSESGRRSRVRHALIRPASMRTYGRSSQRGSCTVK